MKNVLIVFVITLFISSCYSIKLIRDDVNKKYIQESFGQYADIESGELPGIHYQLLEISGNNSIMQDTNLTIKQKEFEAKLFKNQFKWEKNSFYYLWLHSTNAFTDKEINFKIDLVNNKNITLVDYRQRFWIKNINGPVTINYYYWVIKTIKPIIKDNYNDLDLPLYLNVTFPDGKIRKYEITL